MPINRDSEPHHKKIFHRMVLKKKGPWYLLHIWDGRYAAFWNQGLGGEHCIAVAEHHTHEDTGSTWPFAFISDNRKDVERFIDAPENGL